MPALSAGAPRLHVRELNPAGTRPIVMIHGLCFGNLALWYFTIAPRLARTRRVVMFDLKSHGNSERSPTGYDLASFARELAALLDSLHLGNVSLVGFSYGSLIALEFTRRFPQRVDSLALIECPAPTRSMDEAMAFYGNFDLAGYTRTLPQKVQQSLSRGARQERRHRQMLQYLFGETSMLADLRDAADFDDAELATLPQSTLLLYGSESTCLSTARRLARVLPGATLEFLPGQHTLPMERPNEVAAVLQRFFERPAARLRACG